MVKRVLFHYNRERDGPHRPRSVILFDHGYQLFFIVYVIMGVTWTGSAETCAGTAPSMYVKPPRSEAMSNDYRSPRGAKR